MLKKLYQDYRADLMWGLGFAVALIALHIAHREAHPPRMRVTVLSQKPLFSSELDLPSGVTQDTIVTTPDGTVVTNPLATLFIVDNPGKKTIRPEDYITPLTLTPATGEQIYSIHTHSLVSNGPVAKWTILSNHTATMSPALFNPEDIASFILVSERSTTSNALFWWTGRIAGVSKVEVQGLEEALVEKNMGMPFILIMNAKTIYSFFLVLIIFSAITIRLWRQSLFRSRRRTFAPTAICISAIIIIVIAAECVAFHLVIKDIQFIGSYLGLIAYVLFLTWGFVRGIRIKRMKPRATRGSSNKALQTIGAKARLQSER
jgi:hypothetical protein